MSESRRKLMFTAEELVQYMKIKGINFIHISEEAAISFLKLNNNYFKLTSYRKNFIKNNRGSNAGKYTDLDFAYLIDLSTIDMHLRYLLLKICLDIEHFAKVYLIKAIEDNEKEDGYNIVKCFLEYQKTSYTGNTALSDITRSVGNPYCGELLKKHAVEKNTQELEDFPVWAFIEVISFGTFKSLFIFYNELYEINDEKNIGFLLHTVNQLRNAVAHSNCIINNLYSNNPDGVNNYRPDYGVMQFLSNAGIGESMRDSKMKNPRIKQIATTMYVFDKIVTSDQIKNNRYEELDILVNERMVRNKRYYTGNTAITSAYEFIKKLSNSLNLGCKPGD